MSLTERSWNETEGTPGGRALALREQAEARPADVEGSIGELVALVETHEGKTRENAGRALELVGQRTPTAFDAWVDELAAVAARDDEAAAFVGLRALAQLAAVNERDVRPALDAVRTHLDAETDQTRAAAWAVVAEVGSAYPESIADLDARLGAALCDPAELVCAAAVLTAGRVLPVAPDASPETAARLLDTVDAERAELRRKAYWALVNVAIERPAVIPDPRRAIKALTRVTDSELELTDGTVARAISALVDELDDPPAPA